MENKNKILVVDFGAQYAHLIARRVRQLGVYSEIVLPETSLEKLKDCSGIILSGGPSSVYEEGVPRVSQKIFELGKPVLGLCYGHQLMSFLLEGKVEQGQVKEFGTAQLEILKQEGLFEGLQEKETVWMSHGDSVKELPAGFEVIGKTRDCEKAAIANLDKKFFGLQFHPEVTHTPNGLKIFENFVLNICNCKKDWSIKNYIELKCREIKEQVGNKNVFLLASGGVDSTVALALLYKTLGEKRVYALHVDIGFMRQDESAWVGRQLEKLGFGNFHVINAEKEFFDCVKGLVDPEEKRKAIGQKFIDIQNRELKNLDLNPEKWLLGQGTIYPDTIETAGTKHSATIKTHHNRVDSIKKLVEAGLVVEPLNLLYKDEVRALGEELGLSEKLVWRHPFPGPGLAIRCLCSNGILEDVSDIQKRAESVAKEFGLQAEILPIKSVGVQGDARTYAHPCILIGETDWKTFEKASTRITNEIKEINRVLRLLAPDAIDSIELIKATLTRERIALLQQADAIVMRAIADAGLMRDIWQFPTVMIPLMVNGGGESIVLRPVDSMEAMTAKFYPLDEEVLKKITDEVLALNGIGAVFFDLTHKPPGTIEWE